MKNPYLKSLVPIWKNPRFVFVDKEKIDNIACEFKKEGLKTPNWRESVLPDSDDGIFIDFLGLDSSINFCFTDPKTKIKFQTEYKGKMLSGSYAMSACIKRAIEDGIPILDCRWLKNAQIGDLEHIFRGTIPIPLIRERTAIFREVGEVLEEKYGGHFYNVFEEAGYMAFRRNKNGVVDRLIGDFPSFWDVSWHEGSQNFLQFHKRAQLYVIMYQGRAMDSGGRLNFISDADRLGPPADYRVPQVLNKMGILKYESSLERMIKDRKIIKKDSLEEQEIRAQMIYAMVRLCDMAGTWMGPIDYQVWRAGSNMSLSSPHHLTPTIAY